MKLQPLKMFCGVFALCLLAAVPAWAAPETDTADPERAVIKAKIQAHREKQKIENQTFRNTIKDLSPQDKAKAAINHRNSQYEENVAFQRSLQEERMTRLRARLDKNPKLSESDKQEILNFAEQQYQKAYAHTSTQHNENMNVLERIANDPDISAEASRGLIKEQLKAQKEENEQFRQNLKTERQKERQAFQSKIQAKNQDPNSVGEEK